MIVKFPARQQKRRMPFHLVRRSDSIGSSERLSGSGRRRSVRTDLNIKSVND